MSSKSREVIFLNRQHLEYYVLKNGTNKKKIQYIEKGSVSKAALSLEILRENF
jgi:hypothetical protein